MKTLLISLALVAASLTTFAQNDPYTTAMTDAVNTLKTMNAKSTVADMQAGANQFGRIASAEPTQWLPAYYAGLCYSYLGYMAPALTDKDKFLDMAADYAKKAEQLSSKNDEICVLKAQIAQARLTADPMNRWQEYGPAASAELDKATALNADNPRIYALQGSSLYYTPEQFGGGSKAACPVLAKASDKFATFKPVSAIAPNWGQQNVEMLLAKCPK